MAVPTGIAVEQSIMEIDAEIRMESVRQGEATRTEMSVFHNIAREKLKTGLKQAYEADQRIEILEGLSHMKRRLPADPESSLVKKLTTLAENLDCSKGDWSDDGSTFTMKGQGGLQFILVVNYENDKVEESRIKYFGGEFFLDEEITKRINNGEWEDLRTRLLYMLSVIPSKAKIISADKKAPADKIMQDLARYRVMLEDSLSRQWIGGEMATISELNRSPVGWPCPRTSLHPQRIFIYGEPGIEVEMQDKGIIHIDPDTCGLPYAELRITNQDMNHLFENGELRFSYKGGVELVFSSPWLVSVHTLESLGHLGARPSRSLQRTNLIRMISNCKVKEIDIDLVGHELGRDVGFTVKDEWIGEDRDQIIDGLLVHIPENLPSIIALLHRQAVFNSSWESIVAASCNPPSSSSSVFVRFDLIPRGCTWEISVVGNDALYKVFVAPNDNSREWRVKVLSSYLMHKENTTRDGDEEQIKLNGVAEEVERAFNCTWSLSKCLSHLINRLSITGHEWKMEHQSMDTSLPHSDCSISFTSKVGTAWLRKDTIAPPPPPKHEYRIEMPPKGRCPLLAMMREGRRRLPLRVARPRTVPPLRVSRSEIPSVQQQHQQQVQQPATPVQQMNTPFNHIENMVRSVEDGSRLSSGSPMNGNGISTPSSSMEMGGGGGMTPMYSPHPSTLTPHHHQSLPQSSPYNVNPMGGMGAGPHRLPGMIPPSGPSPLARVMSGGGGTPMGGGGMMPGMNPYTMSPQQQHDMMRHQQFMRQQSSSSIGVSPQVAVFDFPDESGASPSSVHSGSPGMNYGYPPSASPLVRGGGTAKPRRARGRKAGNVGDRTPGSSMDSASPGYSPEQKRPKSGPGSRGGRGSRGKRGISMDQGPGMSPFQRSLSEMSNPMSVSSPMTAGAATPLYSQSFDDGTSDEECDPPPFSRSMAPPTSSSIPMMNPSPLTTPNYSISSSPIHPHQQMPPGYATPLPPSQMFMNPSPLAQQHQVTPQQQQQQYHHQQLQQQQQQQQHQQQVQPHQVQPQVAPQHPTPVPTTETPPPTLTQQTTPSQSNIPSMTPSSSSSTPSNPMVSTSSDPPPLSTPSSLNPSSVRRKSSLESVVGQLHLKGAEMKKKEVNDLFDTGLETSPQASPQATTPIAPVVFSEPKLESPRKEGGEEKIVLKLKKSAVEVKKDKRKEKKEGEKDEKKEKRKEEKTPKTVEEKDRKRKGDSAAKEKKDKEAKKAKIEPPLIGREDFVPKMGLLKNFKIPKNKGGAPSDISIPSSSSSLAPPLPSPSLVSKQSGPPPFSQSKQGLPPSSGPSSSGPPYRGGPPGPNQKGGGPPGGPGNRAPRPTKGILKSSGGPMSSGPPGGPPPGRHYPPDRKSSHPPYHEPPRSRQPSGGGFVPPPPPSSIRRSGGAPPSANWVPLPPRLSASSSSSDAPPTLTPAFTHPSNPSRSDMPPPSLESSIHPPPPPAKPIPDSPASPDGLQIVDDD